MGFGGRPPIHVSNNSGDQSSFGNVSEQPPMYGGSSSSQPAYTDDGGYIPQMDYTSIIGSSFHLEQMHGTPPAIQLDDQWFNDEETPDQPRRLVHPLDGTIKHHLYTDKNYREEGKNNNYLECNFNLNSNYYYFILFLI
ncbi:hypothetical protein GQ457_13G010540 [Hibiscus cannabinus]